MTHGAVGERRPLTSMQQSMILATMRAPRAGVYVIQRVCELPESLDPTLLRRAWDRVQQRHSILRTIFERDTDGSLWQRVVEKPETVWRDLDWSDLDPRQRDENVSTFLLEDWERGFDFDAGVPTRFTVLRLEDRLFRVIWTCHHALHVGRSTAFIWREWFSIYDAFVRGEDVHLPAANSFNLHLDWLASQDFRDSEPYWREQLGGLTNTTDYVVDRIRLPGAPDRQLYAKEGVTLSAERTRQAEEFAREHGVSVNNLVQGAWALLLGRYSGRSDIVFGVTRSVRPAMPEARDMVGMLINTLPLRVQVVADQSLVPWLQGIRSAWLALREHEHTSLEKVWEWSGLPRGMPLFESVLIYDHEPLGAVLRHSGGRWSDATFTSTQRTDAPLSLVAFGRPLLTLDVYYDTRLFSRALVAAMVGHLRTLLEGFLDQPDARLGALRMLTELEERRILREWNERPAAPVPDLCIHELFERQAQRIPHQVALEYPGGAITFQELNGRANQLARFLRAKGAAPEDLIAVCMGRSPEAALAVLAVVKSGAAFLQLSPDLPSERFHSMLADARPRLVLHRDDSVPLLSPGCETLHLDRVQAEVAEYSTDNLPSAATSSNAAYAIYTSGSTGTPKAVVVTHRSLVNHTLAALRMYEFSEADRRLQFAALGTDFYIAELFNILCSGATLVFCLDRHGTSVAEFLRLLDQYRITVTGMPTSWWNEWVASMSDGAAPALPRSLRVTVAGMERVNPDAFATWKRVVGNRLRWFNAYGPTETTPTATVYEAGTSPWEDGPAVPIGRPLPNTQAYVLDPDGNPVPVGVAGELYLGGAGVSRGYLHAPDLTAQRFLPDRFRDGAEGRLYRTGDLVYYLPDGNLVFLGRVDRQVKIRGFRIELEEIEAVLAEHPAVLQCAVIAAGPESRRHLVAYVTANANPPDPGQLRLHLSRRLPDYMLPAGFVILPAMPHTPSGKIDRQTLPPYELERLLPEETYQEPATGAEQQLARLWSQVLGLARIGVTDNFFDLGGDSLRATQLLTLIDKQFGKELPLTILFRAPTIARMAAVLDQGAASPHPSWQSLVAIQPAGSRPPFFCLHAESGEVLFYRLLAQYLGPSQPVYGLRSLGLDDSTPPLDTVEAMAAQYVREMRAVQPHGPYFLGGFCLGAYLAWEVARQLDRSGCEVGLLACFDTDSIWRTADSFQGSVAMHHEMLRRLSGPARVRYLVRRARYRVSRVTRTIDEGLFQILSARDHAISARLRKAHIQELNLKAGRAYRPAPLAGTLTYFQPSNAPHRDPARYWGPLAEGGIEVHVVPGAGPEMFQEPHVPALASGLAAALERVQSRSPSG